MGVISMLLVLVLTFVFGFAQCDIVNDGTAAVSGLAPSIGACCNSDLDTTEARCMSTNFIYACSCPLGYTTTCLCTGVSVGQTMTTILPEPAADAVSAVTSVVTSYAGYVCSAASEGTDTEFGSEDGQVIYSFENPGTSVHLEASF